MSYATALDAPVRSQWEANSGSFTASQSNNCGPACMAYIATFYRDHVYGIESTRRLVAPCCRSTDITEQRDMLIKLGVPAAIYNIANLSQLKALIASGRRPVSLRVYMARVPASVRGHSFTGWHTIVAVANGSAGIWMMDPDLRTGAFRYYPDAVVQSAFISPQPAYAVVPLNIKPASAPAPKPTPVAHVKFNTGVHVNLRTAPDARKANIYAVADWPSNDIRLGTTPSGKWIGHTNATRTLYATVSGYDSAGRRVNYNKLRLVGTGRYEYVDSRYMHRV